jgi:hypothetical protein
MSVANSYAVGSVVRMLVQIKDVNQLLVDATTVVITLTLPDTTTSTPTVLHDAVGIYHADYTTVQTGTHSYKGVSTGVVSVATNTFTVTAS